MSKLKVSTREIGHVKVFDLEGSPTQETLQEVAWKIQKSIRRHRLQRVILNLQLIPALEPVGLRKLLAACLRPQRSLIYGVSSSVSCSLDDMYLPRNIRVCPSEKEVAEDLGPFLLEKEGEKSIQGENIVRHQDSIGYQIERRRSKRMHLALPIELKITLPDGKELPTKAIATNISEGGLFAEYLDLESARGLENLDALAGLKAKVHIFPSANFSEELQLAAKIIRKELDKKQLGLAVMFLAE